VRVAVVVLAGGASRRWGGRDKTSVPLGDRTVLEHAVGSLVAGAGVGMPDAVVVGPPDHAARAGLTGVRWVREEPPGGGPVAALAAALPGLPDVVAVVVVGAGDAPFAGEAVPSLLAAVTPEVDGAIGVDADGRDQPLLGVYRVASLRAALASVGDPAGARVRDVVARLRVTRIPVNPRAAFDLDTPEDLAAAERLLSPEPPAERV
jgi:molybdopterin-guanine dinucleotide biosynthesis protein A